MEELYDIEKFTPDICGLDYNRSETAILECSFWGQFQIQKGATLYDPSSIILCGDRYLYVKKIILKQNWYADNVADLIKNSSNKTYAVAPTPYLKESLQQFNTSFVIPPTFAGQPTYRKIPEVQYVEIEKFVLDGNKTSEKDDLKTLLFELISREKIVISEFSNFDDQDDAHVAALLLVLKLMLPLLVRPDLQLFRF